MSAAVVIRHAASQDLGGLRIWLSDAGLPTADLTVEHMRVFLVALNADVPVGMIGLENFGDVGLLQMGDYRPHGGLLRSIPLPKHFLAILGPGEHAGDNE